MKKIGLLLAVVLLFGTASQSFARYGKSDIAFKNGFSLNLVLGGGKTYGTDTEMDAGDIEEGLGLISGLQIGNRWYFGDNGTFGGGLMVNWFDFGYASRTDDGTVSLASDVAFFEIGPMGTYSLGNDMAIDAYYNLRPTVLVSGAFGEEDSDNAMIYSGGGLSHALGTAFRYKIFNVGVEYVLGNISTAGASNIAKDLEEIGFDAPTIRTNSFRFMLGFKF